MSNVALRLRRYAEEREEKNAGENVRSHYTLVSLLLSIGVLSGCQGRTAGQDVDLSCASVASDKAAMVSCATSIVEQLSVEQKVAQMIQGEIRGLTAEDSKPAELLDHKITFRGPTGMAGVEEAAGCPSPNTL